jgi:uncharacterized protein YciI
MVLALLARRARVITSSSVSQRLVLPAFHLRSMSSAAEDKKIYLLRYEYVSNILDQRGPFRAEHLQNALDLKAEGKILMGGALVDPVDTGLFVFSTNDKLEIERFVQNDPYVKNKLVTNYSIREWMVAV